MLLSFLFSGVLATYSGDYYKSIDMTLKGDALRAQLAALNSKHRRVSYKTVWSAFDNYDEGIDGCPNGTVRGIYSATCWSESQQCGNYKKEGDCFNREHLWPKSHWGGMKDGDGASTDLFILFPSDGYVNNRRSNYPLGIVDKPDYESTSHAKLGPCVAPGYSGTCFEVPDMFKGVAARAYFYISAGYFGDFDCCADQPGTNYSDIKPWLSNVLMKWHKQYPPNSAELAINENIFQNWQKNRNPFIDFPDLADQIW